MGVSTVAAREPLKIEIAPRRRQERDCLHVDPLGLVS
jgi:hypothetical protein